jgi:hypothetical protein
LINALQPAALCLGRSGALGPCASPRRPRPARPS